MNSVVEDTYFSANLGLQCRDKFLDLSTPVVMGIMNLTPDSFFGGSRYEANDSLLRTAASMIDEGAQILDLGGYSTRPGAENVSESDELERLIPAIEAIHSAFPDILISADTFRSRVAKKALESGAHIINDISGLQFDDQLIHVVREYQAAYILMHLKGNSESMHQERLGTDPIGEMKSYFSEKIAYLHQNEVNNIVLDPGFGFSKTSEQNYKVLKELKLFKDLKHPILVGVSRKSMIYKTLKINPENALNGTSVLNTIALLNGASILRVHDVKAAAEAIRLTQLVQ